MNYLKYIMKHIINRNRKSSIINKFNSYQRRSTLNPSQNNKIEKILVNQEVSPMYKTNKTLLKYVNQKLSALQSFSQNAKTVKNKNNKSNLQTRNSSFNIVKSNNNKNSNKSCKKNILIKNKKSKIKKGRNDKDMLLIKKEYNSNKIYSSFNYLPNLPNILNNNNNKNSNMINYNNNSMKSPIQTKGKLITNFSQNYTSSMSTGISLNNNNDLYKSCSNFLDNNSFHKYDSNDNENDNLNKGFIPYLKNNFKMNSNEDRNNNTTNNYEIDSDEDNMIDNKIYFKGGINGSPITFGNSFSYTNSKRSSSTRRIYKNNDNDNIDFRDDDNSVFLLKSQNETLKKELKESNEQITYLKNEIEKLIKKNKMKNYKWCIQLNKHPKPTPTANIKKCSKNNSCLDNNYMDVKNYHSHDIKKNKNNKHISKNKKK